MSQNVRFEERDTVRVTQESGRGGRGPPQPRQKEDFAHKVGDALTAGAGPGGYLAVSTRSYIPARSHADAKATVVPEEAARRPDPH